jgi:hypothetical protein
MGYDLFVKAITFYPPSLHGRLKQHWLEKMYEGIETKKSKKKYQFELGSFSPPEAKTLWPQ